MSDHLLRLARITYGLACYADEATNESERIVREAAQLVRDLEAAPQPERRTITREEFNGGCEIIMDEDMLSSEKVAALAKAWRLAWKEVYLPTVEDA